MQTLHKASLILSALSGIYPKTTNILKVVGIILILKKAISLLVSIYKTFLRPRRNLKSRYGRATWALVTGSSDGIGKAIAFQLAAHGFNIILSARTESKLLAVQKQLKDDFRGIDVKVFVLDYANSARPNYLAERVNEELSTLNISILVNNVGVDVLEYYHNLSEEQISNLININCFAVSLLNRIFIPKFQARFRERKLKSAIVNVSSVAGEIPLPLHNTYSASKAYIDFLSRSLSYQYENQIDIISLRPSEVSTPMTFNRKPDIMTILPRDCARGLINDLGYERETNGHWSHSLQSALYHSIPEFLYNKAFLHIVGPEFILQREAARKKA